jgi:hypothetical protein
MLELEPRHPLPYSHPGLHLLIRSGSLKPVDRSDRSAGHRRLSDEREPVWTATPPELGELTPERSGGDVISCVDDEQDEAHRPHGVLV